MRPLISVLIPVYQVEGYLGRCLDSVLAQTYPDLEICMVDDGPDHRDPVPAGSPAWGGHRTVQDGAHRRGCHASHGHRQSGREGLS
ncbi:glycosyltransferase family 2 protein [Acetatifactor aquisgranensis]|uniref:glycosyltransferase family 2 protein n=1 Tax=Acetatifactor aquisgranensis TaxID=2941233 RepID=UPI00203CF92E|nr:glycosyltransferase [uncultured Acetatifactor sp.]